MKKTAVFLLILSLLVSFPVLALEDMPTDTEIIMYIDNPLMTVNGIPKEIDPGKGTKPVIDEESERTIAPIRAIAEALGATVGYDEATSTVIINYIELEIKMTIGSKTAVVDGQEVSLDFPPKIINDRTFMPVRFVVENLNAHVFWFDEEAKILIQKYALQFFDATVNTLNVEEETDYYYIDADIPVICNMFDKTVQNEINKRIYGEVMNEIGKKKEEYRDVETQISDGEEAFVDFSVDSVKYSVFGDNVFVMLLYYEYYSRAAHPNTWLDIKAINGVTGEEMRLNDILKSDAALETISNMLPDYLAFPSPDYETDIVHPSLKGDEMFAIVTEIDFDTHSLEIFFNKGDVEGFNGEVVYSIPLSEIEDLITINNARG